MEGKGPRLAKRFLNPGLLGMLNRDVPLALTSALSDEDVAAIETSNIWFVLNFSPASQTTLNQDVSAGAKLIMIDLNYCLQRPPVWVAATLLHELGHAFLGTEDFDADDYAVERGLKDALLASLENEMANNPVFRKPKNEERIKRLQDAASNTSADGQSEG